MTKTTSGKQPAGARIQGDNVRAQAPRRSTRRTQTSSAARLQGTAGNHAAAQLLRLAQPKLTVGASSDQFEQEADSVAAQVVAALQQSSVRTDAPTDNGLSAVATDETPIARQIQRRAERTDAPTEDASIGVDGGPVDAGLEAEIQSARSGGSALDSHTKASMESAFGADFSDVRLHTGAKAATLNRSIQAKAFTIGSDIFFGGAKPDVSSRGGQELLAHELTHTVQQAGGSPAVQRWSLFGKSEPKPAPEKGSKEEAKQREAAEKTRLASERAIGAPEREKLKTQVGTEDPEAAKALAKRFQAALDEEAKRRKILAAKMSPEEAETRAYKEVWLDGPADLRAIRPVRETGSEKLLSKTNEMRTDQSVVKSQSEARAAEKGTIVSKAVEKLILEEMELVKKKMDAGEPEARAKLMAYNEMQRKTDKELWAKRPAKGSKTEAAAFDQLKSRVKFAEGKAKESTTLDTVATVGSGVSKGLGGVGKATSFFENDSDKAHNTVGEMAGGGISSIADMLSGVFKTVGAINQAFNDISAATKSGASANEIGAAVKSSLAVLSSLTSGAKAGLDIAKSLSESAIGAAASGLPIVSIISDSISVASGLADLIPNSIRYASNTGDLYLARAANKSEMVLIAQRLGQRNAQLFAKSVSDTVLSATKLGTSIAQLATGGADFGASTALGYVVLGLKAADSLGHMIADNVFAVQAKKARKDVVGKDEGTAEELIRRDAAFAVDALITAAVKGDKKQQFLAREALKSGYGVEFTTGGADEIAVAHDRVMGVIKESDDPKTTLDKINDGVAKLKAVKQGMTDKSDDVATLAAARNKADGKERGFFWKMKMWFKSEGAIARRVVQHNLEHGTAHQTKKTERLNPVQAKKGNDDLITVPAQQEAMIKKMEAMTDAELLSLSTDVKKTPSEFMRMVYAQAHKERLLAAMTPVATP